MTDYIPITEAQSDPEAPVDSSLIKRLRDNPIAIAEGSAGAPKVKGLALDNVFLGVLRSISGGIVGINDLDNCRGVYLFGTARIGVSAGNLSDIQIRYSTNNGATFGAWQNVFERPFAALFYLLQMQVNFTNGQIVRSETRIGNDATDSIVTATNTETVSTTVPNNVNAFQIRTTSNSGDRGFMLNAFAIGGSA